MSLRLAVSTEDFSPTLKVAIREAAKCSVLGLRLNARTEIPAEEFSDTALRQLRHYIAECRMQVAGLMYSSRRSLHDPEGLEQRLEHIRRAMVQTRKLGTTELLIRCGRIPNPDETGINASETKSTTPTNSNVDSLLNPFSYAPTGNAGLTLGQPTEAKQFAVLSDILNDLAQYGNHVGCVLQIQPAAYAGNRLIRLLEGIKSGPAGIVFDPATAVMSGAEPTRVFRELYARIGYVRARDAVSDVDGAGVEVALGDGKVDWAELLPTISEAEYKGWVCVERVGGEHRADDVRQGVSRICNLLPGAAH